MGSKPVRSNFFIFLEPWKKSEIFFPRKIGFFFGKNRFLSEKIGFYRKNRRFFSDFFTSDFSIPKSFPAPPKSDFSPKNRTKSPIFLSMVKTKGCHIDLFYLNELMYIKEFLSPKNPTLWISPFKHWHLHPSAPDFKAPSLFTTVHHRHHPHCHPFQQLTLQLDLWWSTFWRVFRAQNCF